MSATLPRTDPDVRPLAPPAEDPLPPRTRPDAMCDVVLKGGITSGVVYPWALTEFARHYRFRGLGGASAGAIGAALGAAAEFGRASGGFAVLHDLPTELGGSRLFRLFVPSRSTRQLLPLLLALTGYDRAGVDPAAPRNRAWALAAAAARRFPVAALLGALPGLALVVLGIVDLGPAGLGLAAVGVLLAPVGGAVAVLVRVYLLLTRAVPANLFGICTGLGSPGTPGLTDWLTDKIDGAAGLGPEDGPLTFGRLWAGPDGTPPPGERDIDLRMVSTCLTQGRPYELPLEASTFFYDPEAWADLFPPRVLEAMAEAPSDPPARLPAEERERWLADNELAARQPHPLRRLPASPDLPVIVAVRMSLSFPLLISAVPLWSATGSPTGPTGDPTSGPPSGSPSRPFVEEWFSDGGLCSNFPVHLFDSPLPTRPTFAINLGALRRGVRPSPDQRDNLSWARTNDDGLEPDHLALSPSGRGAVVDFAVAAVNTARNWSDNVQLRYPGYRDRVVRVLQSTAEGGLNLHMDGPTIRGLAERGRAAAEVMHQQFSTPRFPADGPYATGWDNHRWIRFRALLACLPDFLRAYARGRARLEPHPQGPPSFPFPGVSDQLAADLAAALDAAAAVVQRADADTVSQLSTDPQPLGAIRRIPRI